MVRGTNGLFTVGPLLIVPLTGPPQRFTLWLWVFTSTSLTGTHTVNGTSSGVVMMVSFITGGSFTGNTVITTVALAHIIGLP